MRVRNELRTTPMLAVALAVGLAGFASGARGTIQHAGYSLTVLACDDGGTTTTEDAISGSSQTELQSCAATADGPEGLLDASVGATYDASNVGSFPKRAYGTVLERIYLTSLPQGTATVATNATCSAQTQSGGALPAEAGWSVEVAGCRISGKVTDGNFAGGVSGCNAEAGSGGVASGQGGTVIWTITAANFPSPSYLPLEIDVTTELFGSDLGESGGANATCRFDVSVEGISYEFANDTFLTKAPEPKVGAGSLAAAAALGALQCATRRRARRASPPGDAFGTVACDRSLR